MGATESDFMALQSVRLSTRVEVMYVYLCDKHCYSMQEVAEKVLHDNQSQAGKRVSSIMRCYGFNGKGNAGKYADVAVRDDIEDFVRRYPNGAADGAFEQFIRPRIKQRQEAAAQRQRDQQREQAERWQREQAAKRRAMEQEAERKRLAIEQEAERKRQQQEYEERLRRAQEEERRRQEEERRRQEMLELKRKIQQEKRELFQSKWERAKKLGDNRMEDEADVLFRSLLSMKDEETGGELSSKRMRLINEYGNFLFQWALRERNFAKKLEIYKKVPSKSYSFTAAANNIGAIYLDSGFQGHDLQAAENWFRVSADGGCDKGAQNLANLLKEKDPKQALFYYQRSCQDPEIAKQVAGEIAKLEQRIKDGELPGVSQFLQEHPEWFQVSTGSYDSWKAYAEANRLPVEQMWKKYQETKSCVREEQRFLFFKKKVYQYQGDLEMEDFVGACENEWKRRMALFGTEEYICSEEEQRMADKFHELGMHYLQNEQYQEALKPLCLSASSGNAEAKEALFKLCTEKLKDLEKAAALARSRGDVKACAYMLSEILDGRIEGEMGAAWEALKWLEKGGKELREIEPELCERTVKICAQNALLISSKEPERALTLMERVGICSGEEYGTVCLEMALSCMNTDKKRAAGYLKTASQQGIVQGKQLYAEYLLSEENDEKSKAEGIELLSELAEQGEEDAAFYLAELYYRGKIVEADYEKSVYYYEKIPAPQEYINYPRAAYLLAKLKREAKEWKEAFRLCTIAASGNIGGAQNDLGVMYMLGLGTEKNEEEGEKWYRISAANNDAKAALNLGKLYYERGRLEEAKKYLEQAKAGQMREADEILLEVESLLEKRQRLNDYKERFQSRFARRDYDEAITILEKIHEEFPEDEIYSEMLIPCLEESDGDMREFEKHEKLAENYLMQGENALAWEHYKVSRTLKHEEIIFVLSAREEYKEDELDNRISKWRLDFMRLCVDTNLNKTTLGELFEEYCNPKQLLKCESFGDDDETRMLLRLYRMYLELKTDIAWKFKDYEAAAEWLAARYVVKGKGYHYPAEAGILAHVENEKLKDKIETYSRAWETYESFLEQNQLEDPYENNVLMKYLVKRYPSAIGFGFFDDYLSKRIKTQEENQALECRALTVLLALTKSKPVLRALYRLGHGYTENTLVPLAELNTHVVNCVLDFQRDTWEVQLDDRGMEYYVAGQELKDPDRLICWFLSKPWNSQYQVGLEAMAGDLENGESSRWSETICENRLSLEASGDCLDGKQPVDVLSEAIRGAAQKYLGTQNYKAAAAVLRLINLWPYRQEIEAEEMALSQMLLETPVHCAKDCAVLGDYYWNHREKADAVEKAVSCYETYVKERTEIWEKKMAQEPGVEYVMDDGGSADTEEEYLEEFCKKYDREITFRLGQLYLQGDEIGQDTDQAKAYFELCAKLTCNREGMKPWIQVCDVVKRASAGKCASGVGEAREEAGAAPVTGGNLRPLDQLLHKGEKALAIVVDGVDSREKITAKGFTAAMKWAIERECAGNPEGREKLEQIITLKNGKKLPGGLPARFFSPMLSPEEQKEFTIPAASVKQIEGTNLVLLFHYSSELLCEILVNVLKYMGADLDRFQLVIDSEA